MKIIDIILLRTIFTDHIGAYSVNLAQFLTIIALLSVLENMMAGDIKKQLGKKHKICNHG